MMFEMYVRNYLKGLGYHAGIFRSSGRENVYVIAWKGEELLLCWCFNEATNRQAPIDVEEEFVKLQVFNGMRKIQCVHRGNSLIMYEGEKVLSARPMREANAIAKKGEGLT